MGTGSVSEPEPSPTDSATPPAEGEALPSDSGLALGSPTPTATGAVGGEAGSGPTAGTPDGSSERSLPAAIPSPPHQNGAPPPPLSSFAAVREPLPPAASHRSRWRWLGPAVLAALLMAGFGVAAQSLTGVGPFSVLKPWGWFALAIAAVLLTALAVTWAAAAMQPSGHPGPDREMGFGASFVGLGPIVIGVATGVTVLVFLYPADAIENENVKKLWEEWGNYVAVGAGVVLAAVVGSLFSLRRSHHVAPENIQPRLFGELSERWLSLDARIRNLCPAHAHRALAPDELAVLTSAAEVSCAEAEAHRNFIASELCLPCASAPTRTRSAANWLLGMGFVDLWVRLHDAEEALFVVAPREQVVALGVYDEGRLVGSHMQRSDALLGKLRAALAVLGGDGYLAAPTAVHPPPTTAVDRTPSASAQARFILRDVRHAINQYRDARREGLARARNQLIWTGLITGLLAYALLAFTVLLDVPLETFIAGVVFFLVGAVVGLFDQLRVSTGTESGTEDFGLGQARLFYTPMLSGLAGVGGVLVTAMLYASLSGPIVTYTYPSPSATPAAPAGGNALNTAQASQVDLAPPRLDQIFDLEDDRFGLVIAAVFGLTPSLLVARLQGQAERYKADLQSTSADAAMGTVTMNP